MRKLQLKLWLFTLLMTVGNNVLGCFKNIRLIW